MTRRTKYRKYLLQAVEAFLEGTPEDVRRAHLVIRRCSAVLQKEAKEATLDEILWGVPLSGARRLRVL